MRQNVTNNIAKISIFPKTGGVDFKGPTSGNNVKGLNKAQTRVNPSVSTIGPITILHNTKSIKLEIQSHLH